MCGWLLIWTLWEEDEVVRNLGRYSLSSWFGVCDWRGRRDHSSVWRLLGRELTHERRWWQSFDTSCAGQWFSLLGMRTSWDSTSNHSQCGWDSWVDGPCERWSGLWGGTVWVLKTHCQAMSKRNLFSHCSSCQVEVDSQQMDLSLVQKDVVVCEALASWSPWELPSEDVTDALRLTFWFVGLEQIDWPTDWVGSWLTV